MPREEVLRFAEAMERELEQNDYKGGWKDCSLFFLIDKLKEETRKLILATNEAMFLEWKNRQKELEQHRRTVLSEAADVANIAMMIADVCKTL